MPIVFNSGPFPGPCVFLDTVRHKHTEKGRPHTDSSSELTDYDIDKRNSRQALFGTCKAIISGYIKRNGHLRMPHLSTVQDTWMNMDGAAAAIRQFIDLNPKLH